MYTGRDRHQLQSAAVQPGAAAGVSGTPRRRRGRRRLHAARRPRMKVASAHLGGLPADRRRRAHRGRVIRWRSAWSTLQRSCRARPCQRSAAARCCRRGGRLGEGDCARFGGLAGGVGPNGLQSDSNAAASVAAREVPAAPTPRRRGLSPQNRPLAPAPPQTIPLATHWGLGLSAASIWTAEPWTL